MKTHTEEHGNWPDGTCREIDCEKTGKRILMAPESADRDLRAAQPAALRSERSAEVLVASEPNTEICPDAAETKPGVLPASTPAKPPTAGLVIIVKNGMATLPRLVASLPKGVLSELIVMDVGSTDGSVKLLEDWANQHQTPIGILQHTPSTHPASFFRDEPGSYPVPLPEDVPCTGEMLLCDWSLVRNTAIAAAGVDYVLMLDVDNYLDNAGVDLREFLAVVHHNQIDVGFSHLAVLLGERIVQEEPSWRVFRVARFLKGDIRFEGPVCERLRFPAGLTRTLNGQQNLRTFEQRDSAADTGRKGTRAFKVLWRHIHLLPPDKVEPMLWFHLGEQAVKFATPALVKEILDKFLASPPIDDERERGMALVTLGHFAEKDFKLAEAANYYDQACEIVEKGAEERHHYVRVAHQLMAQSGFNAVTVRKIVQRAEEGIHLSNASHVDGEHRKLQAGSLIIYAVLCNQLGRKDDARRAVRQGIQLTNHPRFHELGRLIGGMHVRSPRKKKQNRRH